MSRRPDLNQHIHSYEYIAATDDDMDGGVVQHILVRRDGTRSDFETKITSMRPGAKSQWDIVLNDMDVACFTIHAGDVRLMLVEDEVELEHPVRFKAGDQFGIGPDLIFYLKAGSEGAVVRDERLEDTSGYIDEMYDGIEPETLT